MAQVKGECGVLSVESKVSVACRVREENMTGVAFGVSV